MSTLVTLTGVNKAYGKKPVLQDINLQVEAGQILGLIGPNGAGKTTCLQAMLGLVQYEGDISMLGHNPQNGRAAMLNDVAYIADVAILPRWLRVDQALAYMQGVHPKFSVELAKRFLAKTNIPLNAKVKTLSKGMVTQLHLALVLAVDARILILDEPTLGLDILTRRQFYTHLLEDFYDEDKCIIVTTHQIGEIENILTHVSFINQGQLVLNQDVDSLRERFRAVAVHKDCVEQARTLNPVSEQRLMGITTMLFDGADLEQLKALGNVTTPSLADVFVCVMDPEAK